jgi:F-type H+-transporting ATPase subunit gamma
MANVKELKKKIKSTKGTWKITQAMKLVSAAKLARAQGNILNSRPYARELEDTIKVVSALVQNYHHEYLVEKNDNKQAVLLVISSDRGLCGSYNSQLTKKVKGFVSEAGLDLKLVYIGRKVRDQLAASGVNAGKTYTFKKAEASFSEMENLGVELSEMFTTGEVGKVYVAFNTFHSAMSFTPTIKQLLPMTMAEEQKEELREKFPFDFKYEPTPTEILNTLIPQTYISTLYTALLDAVASEHGSRMAAMDSASGNCKKAIRTLSIKMNKLRQAAITTELSEVVSGAESVNA